MCANSFFGKQGTCVVKILEFQLGSLKKTNNEPWNTETHKTDRNPPIKNHKPWPFEPLEVNFCCPWDQAQKAQRRHIFIGNEKKAYIYIFYNFLTFEIMQKWNNQHVTSVEQRKHLNPQQDAYLCTGMFFGELASSSLAAERYPRQLGSWQGVQLFLHNKVNRLFHNVLLILWPLYRKLSKLLVYSLNQHP